MSTLDVVRGRTGTSAVAAGSLVAGFGVAQATGIRALGGVVLLAGGAWCFAQWQRELGTPTAAALGTTYLAAFVGSHLLAKPIGAWPAVLTVAAVTGAASYAAGSGTSAPSRS